MNEAYRVHLNLKFHMIKSLAFQQLIRAIHKISGLHDVYSAL